MGEAHVCRKANKMKCWECGKKGTVQFDMLKVEYFMDEIKEYEPVSKRWYCQKCYDRVREERHKDRAEYVRLKKKLMYERAVRIFERQDIDLYEYKEAFEAVKEFVEECPDKFDSSHEMVAAAVLIYNEIPVKVQYKVAGYRVDFYIPDLKAVLEIDGAFHKFSVQRDSKRDTEIRSALGKDVEVVRIGTDYIEQNAELLVEAIKTIREERQKLRRKNYGILPEWYKK